MVEKDNGSQNKLRLKVGGGGGELVATKIANSVYVLNGHILS